MRQHSSDTSNMIYKQLEKTHSFCAWVLKNFPIPARVRSVFLISLALSRVGGRTIYTAVRVRPRAEIGAVNGSSTLCRADVYV